LEVTNQVNLSCPKLIESALSDALLMSSFQKIAADAAFQNRASCGFFVSLSSKVLIDSQILARKPDVGMFCRCIKLADVRVRMYVEDAHTSGQTACVCICTVACTQTAAHFAAFLFCQNLQTVQKTQ